MLGWLTSRPVVSMAALSQHSANVSTGKTCAAQQAQGHAAVLGLKALALPSPYHVPACCMHGSLQPTASVQVEGKDMCSTAKAAACSTVRAEGICAD